MAGTIQRLLTPKGVLPTLPSMYKIVGADQKEYGPVTEEQVRDWITEGRANAQTIARFNDGPWKPLSTFPEFASILSTTGSGTPPVGSSPPPVGSPLPPLQVGPSSVSEPPPPNGMAVAGVTCGVLGLFCCGPIFSTLALVFSLVALSQIQRNPMQNSGKGAAIAGLVLGVIGYAVFALLMFSGVLERTFRELPGRF